MQATLPKAVVPQGGSHDPYSIGLNEHLIANLTEKLGIDRLFTMQAAVIGYLLRLDSVLAPGDILLSSPTGTGKTLAYALPIVHALRKRFIPRLRCLVVVPSRDLAVQVKEVFEALADGTSVSVVLVTGSSSMSSEQKAIESAEILIATPGRLVDHVKHTASFTLEHVKYLVLDEADRLLDEFYYGWLDTVVPVCGKEVDPSLPGIRNRGNQGGFAAYPSVFSSEYSKPRKILVSATLTGNPRKLAKLELSLPKSFVATGKIHMAQPSVGRDDARNKERFQVPDSLREIAYVVDSPSEKLLVLIKLLGWIESSSMLKKSSTRYVRSLKARGSKLIFTKSVSSAHRLRRLLEIFCLSSSDLTPNTDVVEISGDLPSEYRAKVAERIHNAPFETLSDTSSSVPSKTVTVVCSDVFARGMDISSVDVVINYDVPTHVKTYLHRSGRTARAGKPGVVVSIVVAKEAHHFKLLLKEINRGTNNAEFPRLDGEKGEFERFAPKLSVSLNNLKRIIKREELGLLAPFSPLPNHTIEELQERVRRYDGSLEMESVSEESLTNPQFPEKLRPPKQKDWDEFVDVEGEKHARRDENLDEEIPNHDRVEDLERIPANNHCQCTEEDKTAPGEDSFQDLLQAQIMRNYLETS